MRTLKLTRGLLWSPIIHHPLSTKRRLPIVTHLSAIRQGDLTSRPPDPQDFNIRRHTDKTHCRHFSLLSTPLIIWFSRFFSLRICIKLTQIASYSLFFDLSQTLQRS